MELRDTRAARSQEAKRRLLSAAADVLRRRGFKAATLQEVAARAGYTTGAVYAHFDGKEDLYFSVLEEHLDHRLKAVRATARGLDIDNVGAAVGERLMRVLAEEREWVLLFVELAPYAARDRRFRARLAARHGRIRAAIAALVDGHAAALGLALPIGSEDLATALIAFSNGLALERVTGRARVPDELYGQVIALLVQGLRSSASTAGQDLGEPSEQ
jgi:AcrR family transcriptional regulator